MTRGYSEIIQSTQLEEDHDIFNRWGASCCIRSANVHAFRHHNTTKTRGLGYKITKKTFFLVFGAFPIMKGLTECKSMPKLHKLKIKIF